MSTADPGYMVADAKYEDGFRKSEKPEQLIALYRAARSKGLSPSAAHLVALDQFYCERRDAERTAGTLGKRESHRRSFT